MMLTTEERKRLAALADVLIPAGEGFPCASDAGLIDAVMECRPELLGEIKKLLRKMDSCNSSLRGGEENGQAREIVKELERSDPAAFGILAEVVAGAYFLNPAVRERLGYGGQTPKAIDPARDYLDDGLLQSVLDRGAVYRPTPPKADKKREA